MQSTNLQPFNQNTTSYNRFSNNIARPVPSQSPRLATVVHLSDFTTFARKAKFRKGDFIYNQRDTSNAIYLISSGRVKIATSSDGHKEITKFILHPEEVFGEMTVLGCAKRKEYAMAMDMCETVVFDANTISSLLQKHPSLYYYFIKLIGSRTIIAENRLESLVFDESRTRIVNYLITLAVNRGRRVGYETLVSGFITHQEIANLTSTSRQTVTTILNELRNDNILTFNRRRLLIRDLEKLEKAK